jgi:uncharacterized protein DUF4157
MEIQTAQKKAAPVVNPGKKPRGRLVEGQHANVQSILHGSRIQPKLRVGQPNDKYEQEADRVAEQVMRMPAPQLSFSADDPPPGSGANLHSGTVQRACAACSGEYKAAENESRSVDPANLCPKCQTQEQGLVQSKLITLLVQRQESLGELQDDALIQTKTNRDVTPEVTPSIDTSIQSLKGGGQPLSKRERGFFEPRIGADFSNVRVHSDSRAAGLTRSINARAFTHGHNVVFGAGEYSPNTAPGRKLLAHELTHVVQQSSRGQTQTYIQRDVSEGDVETEDVSGSVEPAPDFGSEINEPECPSTPTNLGNVRAAPDCPDDEEELDGKHFKFCIDSDVFTNTERTKLRGFVRNQPAMTTFTIHGYSSVDERWCSVATN